MDTAASSHKPLYSVPSMADIVSASSDDGPTVVSTFAGCGGSSTGYRLAGFRVLYANEFDKHAVECYRLNKADYTVLDDRDIHAVTGQEILDTIGLREGELDVLDGSPPCQSFSTAGKRKMSDPRSTLFYEYARLVRELRPKCFVAENVSGLVKGVAKGYFKWILKELKACGYIVEARLLDAQWLGVPQRRQRIIFIGVRNDVRKSPVFPKPLKYNYSVREACPELSQVCQSVFHGTDQRRSGNGICPTVRACGGVGAALGKQWWCETTQVLYTNGGFKVDEDVTNKPCGTITKSQTRVDVVDSGLALDKSRQRACDGENVFGAVNPADDNLLCSTVQTVPHDTPLRSQRRKFTIDELKRICSYPDGFQLSGSYAQQWARLGNSVPPAMMWRIATTIRKAILGVQKAGIPLPEDV